MSDSGSKRVLFISIKPKYIKKILEKTKTVELRKSRPKVKPDDIVLLYATTPIKAILGYAYIKDILIGSPEEIWELTEEYNGISRKEFVSYYGDVSKAYGICLKQTQLLKNGLKLEDIRDFIPNFHPPQTYKYISKEIFDEKIYQY